MHEYLFDVKLFAAIRVKAESEEQARSMLKSAFDCASCNGGAWPNGDPILFEASQDEPENDELVEIDGEAPVTCTHPNMTYGMNWKMQPVNNCPDCGFHQVD